MSWRIGHGRGKGGRRVVKGEVASVPNPIVYSFPHTGDQAVAKEYCDDSIGKLHELSRMWTGKPRRFRGLS